jgi:DNA-binding sugar fermentation-stimulating protein
MQIDGADPDSEHTVVHCPNTGPMTGLLDLPMANVWLSTSANAKRKYAHTLEAIQPEPHGPWVGDPLLPRQCGLIAV